MIHFKVKCFLPFSDECDKLLVSHHVKVHSKNRPRSKALPTVEESAESPEADGAVDKIPFSPIDLEAGRDTPEPVDEVRTQSLREKHLAKFI